MKKTVKDVSVNGKRCLVRVDFNVPIKDGVIGDVNRIEGALPTIKYLSQNGAKVFLCSHLGRPKGEFNMKYSLKPVCDKLNEYLDGKVKFSSDIIGENAKKLKKEMKEGDIILLENLRFHKEEEENDKKFCKQLAKKIDIFVNDAFGTAHRAHASTAGVAQYGFVKSAVSGFLIEKELEVMGKALSEPERPFVAILGGAKVSDKIGVIKNLLKICDTLLIGGGMSYTFEAAKGWNVGNSLCERDKIDLAKELMEEGGEKIIIPIDHIVANKFDNEAERRINTDGVEEGYMGMDIGPQTTTLFANIIKKAKTVIWNGPMGVFEMPNFSHGTKAVAEAMAKVKGVTIIGGGDSAAAVISMGFADKMTHISTGGGASLEYLEGLVLPGIDCLNDK
jgi:phosphoglycerate kinase